LKKTRIQGLVSTFGEKKPGELGALFDSSGKLCVCVVNGSAAARLGSRVGDSVEVIFG
jgi:S-adenosylmethionine hydrolase